MTNLPNILFAVCILIVFQTNPLLAQVAEPTTELRPTDAAMRDIMGWYYDRLGPLWFEIRGNPTPIGRDDNDDYFLVLEEGQQTSGTFKMRRGASFWHLRLGIEPGDVAPVVAVHIENVLGGPASRKEVFRGPITYPDSILELLRPPFPKGEYHIIISYVKTMDPAAQRKPKLRWYGISTSDAIHMRLNPPK